MENITWAHLFASTAVRLIRSPWLRGPIPSRRFLDLTTARAQSFPPPLPLMFPLSTSTHGELGSNDSLRKWSRTGTLGVDDEGNESTRARLGSRYVPLPSHSFVGLILPTTLLCKVPWKTWPVIARNSFVDTHVSLQANPDSFPLSDSLQTRSKSTGSPSVRHSPVVRHPETDGAVRSSTAVLPPLVDSSPTFIPDVQHTLDNAASIRARVDGWRRI